MKTPHDRNPANLKELLLQYPTREAKLLRIGEIEKRLAKWEREDEENDPNLIRGHIQLTRGFRFGCGVAVLCLTAMSGRIIYDGHKWGWIPAILTGLWGLAMLVRGLIYRPDPQMIIAAYQAHRGTDEYRKLIEEMEALSRALAQDLRAEDESV